MSLRRWGLFAAAILGIVLAFALHQPNPPSAGIDIFLPQPIEGDGRWLFVHLAADRKLSLNRKDFTSRETFRSELSAAVCQRAERVVFFQADSSLSYSDVAQEMGEIHALCDVKIALVTTRYDEGYLFGLK